MAQTLLVLSILNLVFAVPVVPQASDAGNYVVVATEDATTVSERRRRGTPPGGTTPSQYSSSPDGSPPHDSLPLEESAESALFQGSAPSSHLSATGEQVPVHDSTTEASTFAHPLSAADGPAPVPDSISEASTSSHYSSATDRPVPVHDSTAEGSTTPHYTAVTLDMLGNNPHERSKVQKIARFTLLAGITTAVVLFLALHKNHNNDNHTGD